MKAGSVEIYKMVYLMLYLCLMVKFTRQNVLSCLNYKKLKALANICKADSIQFLASNSTNVLYIPDSQGSESDSNESERSDPGWEERERLRRLNEMITKVKEMRFDEDVMTVDNWEELFSA
ncbi:hypothetical protein BDF21DRAFT_415269 [Thamnidium elegans]|nr:hypothetical protein BDF21DRAFT_415269 [Thamnidium elegans]